MAKKNVISKPNEDEDIDMSLFMINKTMTRLRIKRIRNRYGMLQADFAEVLGVAYNTYRSWEIGVRRPSGPSCALLQIAEKHPRIFLANRKEFIATIMKYFRK
jgi:DNA-binding transcriptional regulator YiaG